MQIKPKESYDSYKGVIAPAGIPCHLLALQSTMLSSLSASLDIFEIFIWSVCLYFMWPFKTPLGNENGKQVWILCIELSDNNNLHWLYTFL